MRPIFAAGLLVAFATVACAGEPLADGSVTAGGFGMDGADYYGDVRSWMPFTREAPPRPVGVADVERVRAARRRTEAATRRTEVLRPMSHRRPPHG